MENALVNELERLNNCLDFAGNSQAMHEAYCVLRESYTLVLADLRAQKIKGGWKIWPSK